MLERKVQAPVKTPDPLEDPSDVRPVVIPDDGLIVAWRATTAAAPGTVVVRMHTVLRPNADPKLADEALAIGRTLKLPAGDAAAGAADVQQLRGGSLRPQPIELDPLAKKSGGSGTTGTTGTNTTTTRRVVLVDGEGEIEVAIGDKGTSIVVVAGGDTITYSTNGGASFAKSTINSKGSKANDGDLSVAWGPSGNFYYTQLGSKLVSCFRSTDQGASFTYVADAVNQKPALVPPNGRSVDQEHIVADRVNQTGGKDRLYMVFQEGGHLVTRLNCSKDSGATWTRPIAAASGDHAFPRVSVGKDGMVYTVSRAGNLMVIDKFSDCASGLVHQSSFPVRLGIRNVQCPVPGLDRCNDGNTLSSPTIAVDDRDAKHVYLAFAATTKPSGQYIGVIQSTNGGKTFDRHAVAVNGGGPAIRFMPWMAVSNGVGYVGWYDRRNISPMRNDKTSYYKNSVFVVKGKLTTGTEENLSGGVDDLQCNGWPDAPRAKRDATACTKQPQLAGVCTPAARPAVRCDYAVTPSTCPVNTKCQTGLGLPKYGDYNGLAVGGGKLVNVWAATVPPAGAPGTRTFNAAPRVWATVTSVP
jgi:hypothetical protein